jgi:hypothetical protein
MRALIARTTHTSGCRLPRQTAERAQRNMIEPLHIATVGGPPLRFFRSPLNDGRPDLPWPTVDDLHECLRLHRKMRRAFLATLCQRWKQPLTVAIATGIARRQPVGKLPWRQAGAQAHITEPRVDFGIPAAYLFPAFHPPCNCIYITPAAERCLS